MDLHALRRDLESLFDQHLGKGDLKSNTRPMSDGELYDRAAMMPGDDVSQSFMDATVHQHEKLAAHIKDIEGYVQDRLQQHDQRLTDIEHRLSIIDGRKA